MLTEEQKLAYNSLPECHQKVASVYKLSDDELYHLHPELVVNGKVKICPTCSSHFIRSPPRIPKLSLAAGVDFGMLSRLNLPPLTIIEELLISRSRIMVSLIKLVGPTANQRQTAKKSHVITFPQPEGATKLAELQRLNSSYNREIYPRCENMKEHLGICFLGSKLQYEALVPFKEIQDLQVRVDVVYQYLHLLKTINPLYHDIEIDESEAMKSAVGNISSQLLNDSNVVIMEDEMDTMNEMIANPSESSDSLASDRQVNENISIEEPLYPTNLASSFVSRLTPADRDPNQSTTAALNGKFVMIYV